MLGPLSRLSEPHAYDLCREHASRMTAPRGWELLRVAGGGEISDDLVALADAVHRAEAPEQSSTAPAPVRPARSSAEDRRTPQGEQGATRHLHVVRSPHE